MKIKYSILYFLFFMLICRFGYAAYQPAQLITQGGIKKNIITDLDQKGTLSAILDGINNINEQLELNSNVNITIEDGEGKGVKAHVHCFETATGTHCGVITLPNPFIQFNPEFHPFLNDTFGTAMNQDVSFGTTGSIIHDGGTSSSVDTGTANVDNLNSLEDTGGLWGTGGEASLVRIGMTVERTTGSAYARISNVTGTVLDLTTIASKGTINSDIFPNGNEAYIINAVWTGTATTGTWDFSTGGVITQSGANDGDQADIEADTSDQKWINDFTALTGSINLNTYNEVSNDILIEITLNSVAVGNSVLINDFIDTGDFDAQQFSIPIGDLGLGDQLVNGVRFIVVRSGGSKPAFTLDDIRLEISGTPAVFKATTPENTIFHITELRIRMEDVFSSVLTDGSMPNIRTDGFLGIAGLTNGIVFQSVRDGVSVFSLTIKNLGDFLATGSNLINVTGDATNTGFTLIIEFPQPIILKGPISENFLSFTINDDLSGLTRFTAAARGALEKN